MHQNDFQFIAMTNQTCLVALDKTLAAIRRQHLAGYAASAARCGTIAERAVRAVHEVGMTLPAGLRATYPKPENIGSPHRLASVVTQIRKAIP